MNKSAEAGPIRSTFIIITQAVLPGTTATQFWDIAGLPDLPSKIGTSADDPADAALAGLDKRDRSEGAMMHGVSLSAAGYSR